MKIVFNRYSETLRQQPHNYVLAHRNSNRWICDPDLAADTDVVKATFQATFSFQGRHGDGDILAMIANKNLEVLQVDDSLTEEQIICFGRNVAHLLEAHHDKEYFDRWCTEIGSKTDLGLGKTILRLLNDVRG